MHPQYTPDNAPLKECTGCGEEKPSTPEYFNRKRRGGEKLVARCKECRAAYRRANRERDQATQKKWRERNKEHLEQYQESYREENRKRILAQRRQHYQENRERILREQREHRANNPELYAERDRKRRKKRKRYLKAYHRAYYRKNRRKMMSRFRAYYRENREELKERAREYYAENRRRYRAYSRRRKARKRNAPGDHTAEDVERQYERQDGRCYYCNEKVGDDYHVDHVIPLSRGGSNGPENIVISCASCNLSKRDKLPHEWPEGGRLL